MGEIFDIIIDYPDSKGALQDLKVSPDIVDLQGRGNGLSFRNVYKGLINDHSSFWLCERRKDQLDSFSASLTALNTSNARRLLHPGADTKDILAQYVSIMRCLRFIDPPGVLLHKVADPIRKYLRYETTTHRVLPS